MTKYIFVTGGVVSGLGKGITAASLGRLLKARGLKVAAQKLDPYINVDPGTMSPYQHGEVYVTEDGAETDLDLGHYERFIDEDLNKYSNLTTGKVYSNVLSKERRGEYLGTTVQTIPHITDEIKRFIYNVGSRAEADVVITEIGGTIGDIESQPFIEAIRQVGHEVGRENALYIHVTLVPYLKASGEHKSKPTQHSVKELQGMGIRVVMLTGDNEQTAKAVAEQAGIDRVISNVLPGQKAECIRKLRSEKKHVVMVGDGINDAPALVTADVGMAIGAGTDIAMESADVVLMNSALSGIYNAISLSKATIRNIRQNLFWAFFYNILGIPVAAGVLYPAFGILLSPMIGAAAMSFSSVFVVTNALRLRFFKTEKKKCNTISSKETVNMETVIYVEGMMCVHCKARVESVCKEVAGTTEAVVDLQKKTVTVTGTADRTALEEAIKKAGYEVVG